MRGDGELDEIWRRDVQINSKRRTEEPCFSYLQRNRRLQLVQFDPRGERSGEVR